MHNGYMGGAEIPLKVLLKRVVLLRNENGWRCFMRISNGKEHFPQQLPGASLRDKRLLSSQNTWTCARRLPSYTACNKWSQVPPFGTEHSTAMHA
eukprot:137139-Pelagomonas_calceolata.AAC.2